MLNNFEQNRDDNKRLANIILLKIPPNQNIKSLARGGAQRPNDEQIQIVGGYASHGWGANSKMMKGDNDDSEGLGNDTCFLFNLNQNLRFNAVKG